MAQEPAPAAHRLMGSPALEFAHTKSSEHTDDDWREIPVMSHWPWGSGITFLLHLQVGVITVLIEQHWPPSHSLTHKKKWDRRKSLILYCSVALCYMAGHVCSKAHMAQGPQHSWVGSTGEAHLHQQPFGRGEAKRRGEKQEKKAGGRLYCWISAPREGWWRTVR